MRDAARWGKLDVSFRAAEDEPIIRNGRQLQEQLLAIPTVAAHRRIMTNHSHRLLYHRKRAVPTSRKGVPGSSRGWRIPLPGEKLPANESPVYGDDFLRKRTDHPGGLMPGSLLSSLISRSHSIRQGGIAPSLTALCSSLAGRPIYPTEQGACRDKRHPTPPASACLWVHAAGHPRARADSRPAPCRPRRRSRSRQRLRWEGEDEGGKLDAPS
jgi:hypothetical protein